MKARGYEWPCHPPHWYRQDGDLTVLALGLTCTSDHPDKYVQHSVQFLDNLIMVVVYPADCSDEEKV